ncbi:MAG: hypothetical protein U0930_11305 [Pirellulales bacterium]
MQQVCCEIINQEFRQSLADLINHYTNEEPNVKELFDSSVSGEITAIIGLAEPQIAASISLTATKLVARKLAMRDDANPRDWLGELSNQLAGRLKNKMTAYGHSPNLTTPTTVTGAWLLVEPLETQSYLIVAEFSGHQIAAQLILDLAEDLKLEKRTSQSSAEEGSLQLF